MKNRVVKGKRVDIIILAVAVTVALLFTACAPGPAAEEEKVVKIAFMGPVTGAPAAAVQALLQGGIDYTRWFNEEQGIPGVTVELVWADDKFDVIQQVSLYRRLLGEGIVILSLADTLSPLPEIMEKDKVPLMKLGITTKSMYPPLDWVYSVFPCEAERNAVAADWIMENWEEERPPRMVFMVPDSEGAVECIGPFGQYAESIGMELLPTEYIPYVPLDSTVQLLRVKQEGADFVCIGNYWGMAMPVIRDAERLGLTDELGFCLYSAALVPELVDWLGPAAQGVFGPQVRPLMTDLDNPGIKFAREVWARYHEREPGPLDVYCFTLQTVPTEAVRRAIEKVGYENLDCLAVKEALDTFEDYDPHGFGTPITYTDPELRRGSPWARVYQIQGAGLVPVTDWREAPVLWPVD